MGIHGFVFNAMISPFFTGDFIYCQDIENMNISIVVHFLDLSSQDSPSSFFILVCLNNFEKMGHQGAVQNEDLPNYVHNCV